MGLGGAEGISGRISGFLEKWVYLSRQTMEFLLMFLLVYIALDTIILAWFFATPLMAGSGNRLFFGLSMLAYNFGYLVSNCHEMFQRSLIYGGFEMPFCARDAGIYVGCIIGALLPFTLVRLPRFTRSFSFFVLSMVPMAVDGVSQTIFDMRESSNGLRVATGLLFGFGLVYFFALRIVERSRGEVDFASEAVKVVRISVLASVVLLVAGYIAGGGYITRGEAIAASGLNPSFVTYASARTLETLRYDPYLDTYDDAVLSRLRSYGPHRSGVWVLYEGSMEHEGKYVFFSGGDGRFQLVPDSASGIYQKYTQTIRVGKQANST
jgi:uncharacterized membrane protein